MGVRVVLGMIDCRTLVVTACLVSTSACRTSRPVGDVGDCPRRVEPRATSQWWRQAGRPGIEVTITNPATQRTIKGAQVFLGGTRLYALGDSLGRAVVDSVPPGRYAVHTRRIGHVSRVDTLQIVPRERWVGEVQLPEAIVKLTDECGFIRAVGPRK